MDIDDGTVREVLDDGNWDEAVEEWKRDSELDSDDVSLVETAELLDDFWDAEVNRVGYEAPSIPRDWKEKDYADDVEGWSQVSRINMQLSELGEKARQKVEEELGVE
ncbi:MAG: hypothetical protein SV760_01500 [Halobacteria archaeon]|nr:hypothetical protein [Halobacteria archaeon]